MPDLLSGPTVITFPLWKGQDTYFVVNRRDPNTGNLIDYDENTSAKVVFTSGKNEVLRRLSEVKLNFLLMTHLLLT